MAGSFRYEAEHYDVSLRMAERALLPSVRGAAPDTLIVADGTSRGDISGERKALLHGHCHQKALGAMPDVVAALQLVPGLSVQVKTPLA